MREPSAAGSTGACAAGTALGAGAPFVRNHAASGARKRIAAASKAPANATLNQVLREGPLIVQVLRRPYPGCGRGLARALRYAVTSRRATSRSRAPRDGGYARP